MKINQQKTPQLEKLGALIKEARIGMLTTVESDVTALRSRPLATAALDDEPALWFLTSMSSPKGDDIDEESHVCVSYAHNNQFVSVSGKASFVRDRAKIADLWTPIAKVWFPKGVEDPDLAALKVAIHSAEYWEGPVTTVTKLFAMAAALVTGNQRALGEDVKISA